MRETLKVKPGIGDAMVAPPCPGEPQGLAEKELGAVGPVSRGDGGELDSGAVQSEPPAGPGEDRRFATR